jgi:hypothetical protein
MAYTTINKPSDYFDTKLYTGNAGTQTITGVDFQPDWTWIKNRDAGEHHVLTDAVRGVNKQLNTNRLNAELTLTTQLTAFTSDGFSVGAGAEVNGSGANMVSWNWLANGAGVSNTDGSITSTVSANTTSGFSIVSWVATGAVGTIGHGLGVAPKMIIGKNRTSAYHWQIGHSSMGWTNQIRFTTDASSATNQWNNTAPTSSVFSVEQYDINKEIGDNSIAYCFAEVKGFSKFGSYTGNGSTDGTFIYTGMKPAFVIHKRTDSAGYSWLIHDNKRPDYNSTDKILEADLDNAEQSNYHMDLLSNGFKHRITSGSTNASGGTYIYMAFAENPLVGTNNIPATAR